MRRMFAVLLLGGAAVLGVVGVYFLATTCWAETFEQFEERVQFGCRRGGAVSGVGVILLAQFLGVVGFMFYGRAARNRGGGGGAVDSDPGLALSLPVMGWIRFSLTSVISVVILGVSGFALYWGLFLVGFSCWVWGGPPAGCSFSGTAFGLPIGVVGEFLGVAGFLVARRAFRRRPWRRSAPLGPLT